MLKKTPKKGDGIKEALDRRGLNIQERKRFVWDRMSYNPMAAKRDSAQMISLISDVVNLPEGKHQGVR